MIAISNYHAIDKRFRVADIHEEPTVEQLDWLRGRGVDGLVVMPARGSRRVFHMDWVEELEAVRFLEITSSRPVGPIPVNAARRLEVLRVRGRLKSTFDLGEAWRLRSLSISADLIHGSLAQLPALEHCGLDRLATFSSSMFEGCHSLKSAYLEGDAKAPSPVWDFHMEVTCAIEVLTLLKISVRSLEGISALPNLTELVVRPKEAMGLDRRVDLSPLAACARLRKVFLDDNGTLYNAQILDGLPDLEMVSVAKGGMEPDLQGREWLSVF